VLDSPLDHRAQYRPQVFPLRGEPILEAGRPIAVTPRLDDTKADQSLQTVSQDIRRDAFRRFHELREAPLAANQVAHDEERPSIAQHIECA
jgi:hypothetical protein